MPSTEERALIDGRTMVLAKSHFLSIECVLLFAMSSLRCFWTTLQLLPEMLDAFPLVCTAFSVHFFSDVQSYVKYHKYALFVGRCGSSYEIFYRVRTIPTLMLAGLFPKR